LNKGRQVTVRRRLRSSYLTSLISITLVLFVVGMLGVVIIYARKISEYVRESINVSVVLKDDARDVDIRLLQKTLDAANFVKATEYVSKDKAAEELKEDLGEDFLSVLGYNPLSSSIDIYLQSAYLQEDSLQIIEEQLNANPLVKEVVYRKSLLEVINQNLKRIGLIITMFGLLLLAIALALINNTIRLSLFSRRFLIRTMQLVGASRSFIRKPIILRGIFMGFTGGVLAVGMLIAMLYYLYREFRDLYIINDPRLLGLLLVLIICIGIILNWISTYFIVNRYLKMDEDQLY
jgi:cell division transport system permease protein